MLKPFVSVATQFNYMHPMGTVSCGLSGNPSVPSPKIHKALGARGCPDCECWVIFSFFLIPYCDTLFPKIIFYFFNSNLFIVEH